MRAIVYRLSATLILTPLAIGTAAAQVIPLGPEFQVNTFATGQQILPSLATDAAGNLVIVFFDGGANGGVKARRYDVAGFPLGDDFLVNTVTGGLELPGGIAGHPAGQFVVVWAGNGGGGTDSDGFSVKARRYDAAGSPVGGEFQVNTYTTGYQQGPHVAMDGAGNFVVVWESAGSPGSDSSFGSVLAQRFDGSGTPIGAEFQVNTQTTGNQFHPRVASDAAGNFFVVWYDANVIDLRGRIFDDAGAPLGPDFQVDTHTTSSRLYPGIGTDSLGNFVVVWANEDSSIQARRWDATGTPVGGQFRVDSLGTPDDVAAVSADPTGSFVVVWQGSGGAGTDTSANGIQGRRFDGSGAPLGAQFQVNSYTTNAQRAPAVAPDAAGSFVVTWMSYGSAGSDQSYGSVQAQREGPARIMGKKLLVQDRTGNEDRRRVIVLGKESATNVGPVILGDPTVTGATLRVVAQGTTDSDQTHALDASGWRALGSSGYQYRGPTGADGDPVQRVRLRRTGTAALLQVMLRGATGTQSLDVVPPNTADEGGLELTINGGGTYCVKFGGTAGGTELDDGATRWKIVNATAEDCP